MILSLMMQAALAACPVDDAAQLKASGFAAEEEERSALLRDLAQCAGEADPALRDGLGFEGISTILRRDSAEASALRELTMNILDEWLEAPADSFEAAFLPLYLSEFLRVDRLGAFLSDDERQRAVEGVAMGLASVTDYRGYHDLEGWRHGVAHASDAALQLAVNVEVSDEGRSRLRTAILSQVSPPGGHAYVFGEPDRLARAYVYAVLRSDITAAQLAGSLGSLAGPGPLGSWEDAYMDEAKLARLHNTRAFLNAVIITLIEQEDEKLVALRTEAMRVGQALP